MNEADTQSASGSSADAPREPGTRRLNPVAVMGQLGIVLAVSGAVAWALSRDGAVVVDGPLAGVPVVWLCWAVAFGVQWLAFVPAFVTQTEKFYDLTGSLTYLAVTGTALWFGGHRNVWAFLLAGAVTSWAVRLGTFLFRRIHRDGGDGRFDKIKPDPMNFLRAWTLQGLWVFLTLAAVVAALTGAEAPQAGVVGWIGLVLWLLGWLFEVVADHQKSSFRARPENRGRFIDVGLWSWSRHPNYFGEIVLWFGLAVAATPSLVGGAWMGWISPVFVWLLLTRISGVPLLERRADKRWGGDADYEAYKDRTPVLVPRPPTG